MAADPRLGMDVEAGGCLAAGTEEREQAKLRRRDPGTDLERAIPKARTRYLHANPHPPIPPVSLAASAGRAHDQSDADGTAESETQPDDDDSRDGRRADHQSDCRRAQAGRDHGRAETAAVGTRSAWSNQYYGRTERGSNRHPEVPRIGPGRRESDTRKRERNGGQQYPE